MLSEILVTGASGFVGGRLVVALRAQGHTVREFSLEDGDITRAEFSFPGVRHVYHLAARTFVPDSWRAPLLFFETNVLGVANVLEFCRRQQASLTLVSSYVYGQPRWLPISEDHPVEAFNPYALTKLLAEEIACFYRDKYTVPLTIVRPFNLYGPGQASHFLVPLLVQQALDPTTEYIEVDDERPRRDLLFIDDLIALLVACLEAQPGIYNAGSGRSVGIVELVDAINAVIGQNKPLRSRGERRPEEVLDVVADIRRAREILQWNPRVSLDEGLARTIQAAKSGALIKS